MGTPRDVDNMIDALAYDVYDAYDNPRRYPAPDKAQALTAARYLARKLVRKGWRPSGDTELPRCPYGTVTCFDPEPHRQCEL